MDRQIIRVRSKEGMHRVTVEPTDDVFALRSKAARQPSGADPLDPSGVSFAELGIKHGDMLYAQLLSKDAMSEVSKGKQPATITTATTEEDAPMPTVKAAAAANTAAKDPLDEELERLDGRIPQPRDPRLCHHTKGVCTYCMPLEPYDEKYRESKNIKHLSFHAYLKKLKAAANQASAKQFSKWHGIHARPLTMPDYRVKPNCPNGHAPWPKSICSRCQPNAVTLKRQEFRMVDHVEFSSQMIIDRFLDAWRLSGLQRFGWLYGRYERYDAVPLGIKAVVEAIYEPRQTGDALWVEVAGVEDPDYEGDCRADDVAAACGLVRVGMIWTDLTNDSLGGVICKRHVKSFFMSAQECQFAAAIQRRYEYTTDQSSSGVFGSRNPQRQIEVNAYQVSNEAMAMSEADLIEPSVNPSMLRVKPEAPGRYIPDVFYSRTNEYGAQESGSAKPCFPVEYWLVTLTHGAPTNPSPLFNDRHAFPIEHRPLRREDAAELHHHLLPVLRSSDPAAIHALLANFHVLLSISNLAILSKDELAWIGQWIRAGPVDAASIATLQAMPGWQTLIALLNEGWTVAVSPLHLPQRNAHA
ncbi:putative endoplasmic reticulum and nuclear membrane proteinc Npl4 [Syncephalis pseudoplumigaleata]|uniref:Nuclear protein localization protein 4 n=1 Tax=Syncephalis pseudoplumigaleata TaxID=1712513 RepID=A0A4P9YZM4_9FUNG|nr:putative endoplasmic reticulum and nuclear membrane proteinc Npl4 [Syncephalis pseudoplumigaleata]|eukprot:RKP25633.1 putative endoplasmic reticulum and nuclear membrane proteinc Npl4 [Syncephalis pseudoplumigaleata]